MVGFVYCKDPRQLRKRLRRLLKGLHIRNIYPRHLSELKFYLPYSELIQQGYTVPDLDNVYNSQMPIIRSRVIGIICKYSDGVFAAVLDKRKAKPSWTSEELGNFVFAETLVVNVMNTLSPPNPPIVLYDKGRLSPARTRKFRTYVINKDSYFAYKGYKRYRGSLSTPIDVSSTSEAGIWAADYVAGAFYHKYSNNDSTYANMLNAMRIGVGVRKYW